MSLRELHRLLGATWGSERGEEVPWNYGALEDELETLNQGVALLDFSEYGLVSVAGSDRKDFLHNQCTSDIRRMPELSWLETLFLNNRGQVEHTGLVLNLGEVLWVSSPTAPALANRFRRYIVFDQVEVSEPEGFALLRLHGSKATELAQILGEVPPQWSVWRGNELVLVRDERGIWVVVPMAKAEIICQQLLDAGARPVGREAWRVWRVERGVADLEDAVGELPQEVGWDGRISYKKGCYLGQEIMARLEARGNTRYTLMGLLGQRDLTPGAEVFREGKKVGKVGTAVESPSLGAVALAVLRKELSPGDQVQVEGWSATVSALPMQK